MAEGWTQERIEARIRLEALRQGVDPDLAVAVAKQESNLRADNPGDNGASRGVFHLQRKAAIDAGIDPAMRDDPEIGIVGGVRYLKQRLDLSKGDVPQALSRYNRGTPDYRGIGDPDYVYHVMRHYPGSPLGKAPTDQTGYQARLNRTFGRGTVGEDEPRALMASQTAATTEKPWWDKFVPRFGPRSAEAAAPAKKWYDDLVPEKEPTEATPPTPTPVAPPAATPQATTGQGKWYDVVPEKEPETTPTSPLAASPGAPAPAPLPGEPTAPDVAPVPMQRPPAPTAASTPGDQAMANAQAFAPTASSSPAQDEVYRARLAEAQPPVPTQHPERPDLTTAITPESQQAAQGIQKAEVTVDPDALRTRFEEGGATSTDPAWWSGADPSSPRHQEWLQSSPMPSTGEITRELGATGIETGAGIAGTVAGGAVAGVPGMVGGGIVGQSYGRRLTNQLGLRQPEEPVATGFGLNLYPSDVANASVGLATGFPALLKAGLAKTTAGKAIVTAEMKATEAYQAWQIERGRLVEAQQTGQQAKLNTALKDHATAEANYKRLVGERNDTIAANKAEYDQAVTDYQTTANQAYVKDVSAKQQYLDDLAERQRKQYGTVRAETERELLASREAGYTKTLDQIKKEQADYETKVGAESGMLESQAAAIPEARGITKPYEAGTPSHVLYKDMRDKYSNEPLTLDVGKADLKALRADRPKALAGTPSPFEGEVETIAQSLEKAEGANVATIHEELKKLGPLTRHRDGKIRGDAKQVARILMDVLETAPEAAGAIKAANQRFKREMSLEDINDWLKPGHGVLSSLRGKEIINPDAFLRKFNKEMADSKLFRDSFTPEEAATMRGNMETLAATTQPPPPLRAPRPPTPELLPGTSPPPPATGEALPAGAYPESFTKGLAGAPERTPLPPPPELATPPKEVPPVYPEFPAPGKSGGLTVSLEPPAKIPEAPASTSMWYPEARNKGDWLRKALPKEGQWTREQWETYAKERLGKKPGFRIGGVLSGAGGMAFALQRMGLSPAAADKALYLTAASGVAGGFAKQGEWLLSRALLHERYRPLLQEAMMDNKQLNPYFYNAMLAALTPEDRKEYERMQRSQSQQKARR